MFEKTQNSYIKYRDRAIAATVFTVGIISYFLGDHEIANFLMLIAIYLRLTKIAGL